ncbi:hypothetical protein GDO86_013649 [Hymenochirus boettgeri]|uniref:Alpha-2-macroglobulin-like protein 1 n=1 Tax=Hymenochirus boettgeri TaxID=247094 RepID=A0A8T2IXH8_9PIPI|nr:hypothetical protein GDO86_013649 [Hymenochirus boettgeri]
MFSLPNLLKVPSPNEEEEVATIEVFIKSSGDMVCNRSRVLVKRTRTSILIQTDKAVYKPGQTVKFRVVSLNENLLPEDNEDPGKNRIGQWLNVTLRQGIAELSLPLSSEPAFGEYSIRVKDTVHSFSVEEYVLPKFEVSLHFPKAVVINSKEFPLRVCGRYTYGKPVQGTFKVNVCRKHSQKYWRRWQGETRADICIDFDGKLEKNGCTTLEVESDKFYLNSKRWQMNLEGNASVTEEGTVVDAGDSPIPDQLVYLTSYGGKINQTLVTDGNGETSFRLENTTQWVGDVILQARTHEQEGIHSYYIPDTIRPKYGFASVKLKPFYSRSKSFLKLHSLQGELLCEGAQEVRVEYIIQRTELGTEAKNMDLHYLVESKGTIKDSGSLEVTINSEDEVLHGEVSINLMLSADVSPTLRALVYILLPDGEMAADSATFTIQRCFNNKVSVGFSPDEVLPGSDVTLQIKAAAGSLCALRVVDQSVVLMKPDKELTADKIHNLFVSRDSGNYDYRVQEDIDHCQHDTISQFPRGPFRFSIPYFPSHPAPDDADVYSLFKNMKLKIITSADIKRPRKCHGGTRIDRNVPFAQSTAAEITAEIVRTYFPETWIWELSPVGTEPPSHSPRHHHRLEAGAFCMGPMGLVSPPNLPSSFPAVLVDLALPYSVVRGESFTLKASVFNYLKHCIKVQTTLQPSEELEQEPCDDCQYTSCLCVDESKTFYWNLKVTLGEIRLVVDNVEVFTREHSKPEEIALKVPENILPDSERAYVTVLGDLMGTAMQNLDRLLAMPYGCGEQNMVLFAPNIFILQYLEKTHQLNQEIQSKAKTFLESGYQRELMYKHNDGSYSAFGKSDKEGNTWLTAFVVKSFNKARPYIFIDKSHLDHSFAWLKKNQHVNGCFRSLGKLFNNAMKGGVDDEISLCSYVTMALLESRVSLKDPLVSDALSCLRESAKNVSSVYTQALMAYTFSLSGDAELTDMLMDKLEEKAVRNDGQLHWERKPLTAPSGVPFWYRAPSAEVELTSYVLLALLSSPKKDLAKASEIVNWLSKQQNPYGGFSSTQDTVVALQALATYAEATFSDKGNAKVTVTSKTGFHEQFHLDHTNRLLLQTASLPDIPGDYTVSTTGSGCVYVQTVLRYNVPPPRSDATFAIEAEIQAEQCPRVLRINITTKYTGPREKSNMALIEVKMLSGFIPVKSSVRELEKINLVKRSEIQTDVVNLYLDEVRIFNYPSASYLGAIFKPTSGL